MEIVFVLWSLFFPRSDEQALKRRKTAAASDLSGVCGRETMWFGRKSGAFEARELKYLKREGCFSTTACPFLVVPLPKPHELYVATRAWKEGAGITAKTIFFAACAIRMNGFFIA